LDGSAPAGCEVQADGIPSGRLWRLDHWLSARLGSTPAAFGPVGRWLLRLGVTGVTDMTPDARASDFDPLANAVEAGDLPQQVMVTGAPGVLTSELPPRLAVGPAKILLADHDLPSLDELIDLMRLARRSHRTLAVHCVTRVALVLTLAAYESV